MSVAAVDIRRDLTSGFENSLELAIFETGIPPRPAVLLGVQELLAQPEVDFDALADLISKDVALAAGILKVANSPFFGRCAKARTSHQAIVALGIDITARTISGLMLRRAFPHVPALDRFWDSSTRIAQMSSWLAKRLGVLKAGLSLGDAYTFGLFRDAGIAVMLSKIPQYDRTLAVANTDCSRLFTTVEDERHHGNHAQVGALLAHTWGLPEETCIAIRQHHELPALLATEDPGLDCSCILIALAQLAEWLIQEHSGLAMTCEWNKLGAACRAVLGICENDLQGLQEEISRIEEGLSYFGR